VDRENFAKLHSMLNVRSMADQLDLKGNLFLKEKINQPLNAHWLVFMVNKSTDRYMTPSQVDLDDFTKLS